MWPSHATAAQFPLRPPKKLQIINASFVTREAFPNDVNFKSAARWQTAKTRQPPQP
jgi:hypothetical protein